MSFNLEPSTMLDDINPVNKTNNFKGIFIIAALMIVLMLFPTYSVNLIADFTQYAINTFGLGFILFSTAMVLISALIIISPIGKLVLGGQHAKPEFSLLSWLAMLFTAGMGSGLIFWGIAEPVFHFSNLPLTAADSTDALNKALGLTYFHWGFHAWSIYALAGLAIAWFSFNRGRSLQISSSFTAQKSSPFRLLDWLAIIAIVFGVASTFANTIALVQTGLQQTISAEIGSISLRYGLILLIAVLFTGSSLLGLHRGIKWLSQFNTLLMLVLMTIVILLVDPVSTLNTVMSSVTSYVTILPQVSFSLSEQSRQWSIDWSVIYLVWWVAWAPFVGPFIARISKGRSIRQFLLCVILVPTIASIIWFSAFGGAALSLPFADDIVTAVNHDYTQGLFRFFDHLPMTQIFSVTAIILLITFIITSADSALLVCCMLGGNSNKTNKILWATLIVALSMSLLYINDVDLNKHVAIAGAVPFTLVLIAQVIAMCRDMFKFVGTK
ncbi:BCCT family transporter [Shewanella youngdeokensis]|uniref:BCCT family transporter n=1 Tax=Shewanella youngdeokensis TaxID=2999068 RepID=A0ABZ0K2F3_9GAMM|nr:BCCT family transporter [Shewanella sp. DAU334]